jgi:hypothetical protein
MKIIENKQQIQPRKVFVFSFGFPQFRRKEGPAMHALHKKECREQMAWFDSRRRRARHQLRPVPSALRRDGPKPRSPRPRSTLLDELSAARPPDPSLSLLFEWYSYSGDGEHVQFEQGLVESIFGSDEKEADAEADVLSMPNVQVLRPIRRASLAAIATGRQRASKVGAVARRSSLRPSQSDGSLLPALGTPPPPLQLSEPESVSVRSDPTSATAAAAAVPSPPHNGPASQGVSREQGLRRSRSTPAHFGAASHAMSAGAASHGPAPPMGSPRQRLRIELSAVRDHGATGSPQGAVAAAAAAGCSLLSGSLPSIQPRALTRALTRKSVSFGAAHPGGSDSTQPAPPRLSRLLDTTVPPREGGRAAAAALSALALREQLAHLLHEVVARLRRLDAQQTGEADRRTFAEVVMATVAHAAFDDVEALFDELDLERRGRIRYSEMRAQARTERAPVGHASLAHDHRSLNAAEAALEAKGSKGGPPAKESPLKRRMTVVLEPELPKLPRELERRGRDVLDLLRQWEDQRSHQGREHIAGAQGRSADGLSRGVLALDTFEQCLRVYYPNEPQSVIALLLEWVGKVQRVKARAQEARLRESDAAMIAALDTNGADY